MGYFDNRLTLSKKKCELTGKNVNNKGINQFCKTHERNIDTYGKVPLMSAIAICMNYLLLDSSVNALSSKVSGEKKVYVEYHSKNGTKHQSVYDGTTLQIRPDMPGDDGDFLPLLFYALSFGDSEELTGYFNKVVALLREGKSKTDEMIDTMYQLCDCFYCDFFYDKYIHTTISPIQNEDALINRACKNGLFEPAPILKNIEPKPVMECAKLIPAPEEKKNTSSIICVDEWDDIMNGKYKLSYDNWSDEMRALIPSPELMKEYYPISQYFRALNKIVFRMDRVIGRMNSGITGVDAIKKDYINLTLSGNPGNGKTVMLHNLAAATGLPICTITSSKNTDEDTYEGKNKFINGQVQFVETDFLKFYQNGGIIVLEEVNLADPAVTMGAMGQAIEFPFVLKKDGYETVRRHPLCIICSTKNINTYGSKGVNQAFSNRFVHSMFLEDPSDKEFIEILKKNGFPEDQSKFVHKFYKDVVARLLTPEIAEEDAVLSLSLRTCIGALQTIEEGVNPLVALQDTFIGKIAETNKDVALRIQREMLNNRRITF